VDNPVAERRVDLGRRSERSPRRQDEQVTVEPLGHLGQLGIGADGEGVDPVPAVVQPLRPARQSAQPEAVAVALGDRHQAGGPFGDADEVVSPAVAVDGEGEAHGQLRRPM
jgi:hypothetical protein